jgi:hypothetical protein
MRCKSRVQKEQETWEEEKSHSPHEVDADDVERSHHEVQDLKRTRVVGQELDQEHARPRDEVQDDSRKQKRPGEEHRTRRSEPVDDGDEEEGARERREKDERDPRETRSESEGDGDARAEGPAPGDPEGEGLRERIAKEGLERGPHGRKGRPDQDREEHAGDAEPEEYYSRGLVGLELPPGNRLVSRREREHHDDRENSRECEKRTEEPLRGAHHHSDQTNVRPSMRPVRTRESSKAHFKTSSRRTSEGRPGR